MILYLTTDSFPRETSWKIIGIDGTIYKNSGNIYDQKNTLYEEAEYLLANECYTFTIIDKAGDGFIDLGQYTLFWDGKVIHEGKSTYIPGTNQVRESIRFGDGCSLSSFSPTSYAPSTWFPSTTNPTSTNSFDTNEPTSEPTAVETKIPTMDPTQVSTSNPTKAPTLTPAKQASSKTPTFYLSTAQPSTDRYSPTHSPTHSSDHSTTDSPSTLPTVTPCYDSPLSFPRGKNNQSKGTCTWVFEKKEVRCNHKKGRVNSHCRSSCDQCGVCVDSEVPFFWKGKKKKCKWVFNKKDKRCKKNDLKKTCPKTCGMCD
mmetsp:Transcript_46174/g.55588  ORF Transcript_46174/g.55588 Transcript_46174/m.55588 type:complete len:314 (+) Transcript_46174:3-944(+)